jgi:DNA-binding transcriptional ArsR family regulator
MPTIRPKSTNPTREPDLTISSTEQLHALSNPRRWAIIGRLNDRPASVQELSRSMGTAKGTIGHHVGVLERAGLVRVAETRKVRGVVEKRYARVGRRYKLPEGDAAAALGTKHDIGMLPLRQAVAEARRSTGEDDPSMAFILRARMSADRARRFADLLNALGAEFADGAPEEGETYGMVAAIYVPEWASTHEEKD